MKGNGVFTSDCRHFNADIRVIRCRQQAARFYPLAVAPVFADFSHGPQPTTRVMPDNIILTIYFCPPGGGCKIACLEIPNMALQSGRTVAQVTPSLPSPSPKCVGRLIIGGLVAWWAGWPNVQNHRNTGKPSHLTTMAEFLRSGIFRKCSN